MSSSNWRWYEKHNVILRDLAKKGFSARIVTEKFNRCFKTDKTRSAILGQCLKIGISLGGQCKSQKKKSSVLKIASLPPFVHDAAKPEIERKSPQFDFARPTVDHHRTGIALANAVAKIVADEPQSLKLNINDLDEHRCIGPPVRWMPTLMSSADTKRCLVGVIALITH